MNQIILIEHNMVKNPNWLEANQLAILQERQKILIWDYPEQT